MKLISQITTDSLCSDDNDSSFFVYESLLDNNIYITYFSKNESKISYNSTQNKRITELKNVHEDGFACFSNISDTKNNRDLDMVGENSCMLRYA